MQGRDVGLEEGGKSRQSGHGAQGKGEGHRDADSQRIPFEFAKFAENLFAAQIRCKFGLKSQYCEFGANSRCQFGGDRKRITRAPSFVQMKT